MLFLLLAHPNESVLQEGHGVKAQLPSMLHRCIPGSPIAWCAPYQEYALDAPMGDQTKGPTSPVSCIQIRPGAGP